VVRLNLHKVFIVLVVLLGYRVPLLEPHLSIYFYPRMKTVALAATLFLVGPALAMAATYAYVNTAGEVMSVEASTATQALTTAPNLHVHSGVMLVDGSDDSEVIGDDVPGT